MDEQEQEIKPVIPPPPQPSTVAGDDAASTPPPSPPAPATSKSNPLRFDPSRMIGIIRRKAMIKDLAAVYHAECVAYGRELLELQRKWEESYADGKPPEDFRKELIRQPKRLKKSR
ncbi:hypothetical protein MKW94_013725 [Papaver nudicaule]|uniref:Uncharacterized protein n=1 Tax=Papaver nudicaule TaxID=74823 RepID=A0AA41VS76_PAPNU|nr:hypothetical protein [Papaver nudicaule]